VNRVERDVTRVLYVRAEDVPEKIRAAWEELESRFESLKGRRFYGAFYSETGEYRACVEMQPDDDADALGLERDVLPGGSYARVRLRGEPPAVYERIGPTFEELSREVEFDRARPNLEFYRRRDEIDVLAPLA
jgi:integron-associated effector binding protein